MEWLRIQLKNAETDMQKKAVLDVAYEFQEQAYRQRPITRPGAYFGDPSDPKLRERLQKRYEEGKMWRTPEKYPDEFLSAIEHYFDPLPKLEKVQAQNYWNSDAWANNHAKLNPEVIESFNAIKRDVEAAGGKLIISDMFRTWDEQEKAHRNKPKLAVPAGKSYHQAGLAFDFSVNDLGIPLSEFHNIVKKHGWTPIENESWHIQYPYKNLGFNSLEDAIRVVDNWKE